MSKPFLIQKTPTFDVQFLEEMKTVATVHTIIIRHPLEWYHRSLKNGDDLDRLYVWLQVWAHTLDVLRNGTVESFVVVNYEALVEYRDDISTTLAAQIKQDCLVSSEQVLTSSPNKSGRGRRRLNLHQAQDPFKYLALSDTALKVQGKCRMDEQCQSFMEDLAPVMETFGYKWVDDDIEKGEGSNRGFMPQRLDSSKIIFSSASNTLPSADIVEEMKRLAKKYAENSS